MERRAGRQPATTHQEIEHAAFELFERNGFERTTVDDIAAAVGIARRTFFRYFPSKYDVVWGSFGRLLAAFENDLDGRPDDLPMMQAIRLATIEFNRVEPSEQPWHRTRLALILDTPGLQAYSTGHYRAWRDVVARFAGRRLDVPADALPAQAVGSAALGVAICAYEAWLARSDADLLELLDDAFAQLSDGFPG